MARRATIGVLLTCLLLLPGRLSAQEERDEPGPVTPVSSEIERLERRIEDLEKAKAAQEEATRAIIRQAIEQSGSKINNVAAFGGTFELLGGQAKGFGGVSERVLRLNTFEAAFEVQVDEWTFGSFILQYNDGTDALYTTTEGRSTGIPRINVDTAFLTLGDTQRFPLYGTFGRMVLPFGISTGDPVADVPTLEDPLTVEAFEMLEEGILLGIGLPTPSQVPASPITSAPPVRPRLFNPMMRGLARGLGYRPPPPLVQPPGLVLPPTPPPPLTLGVLFYKGDTVDPKRRNWTLDQHMGLTVGYRTSGPWSFDIDVDYNTSVFDSRFLGEEYGPFLDQIGLVPGMAASLKAKLGPVGLVTEWTEAIETARFRDELGQAIAIRPSAWQASLAFQFDWNSGVESVGGQGTYLALGYSKSHDLAGVTRLVEGEASRVGAVPKRRFLVSLGEWVLDGCRLAVEYSHVLDYPRRQGGTGRTASAVLSMLTYDW